MPNNEKRGIWIAYETSRAKTKGLAGHVLCKMPMITIGLLFSFAFSFILAGGAW